MDRPKRAHDKVTDSIITMALSCIVFNLQWDTGR